MRQKGKLRSWNDDRGFGFIEPSDGGKDVFVHITAVQKAGLTELKDGQKVTYDLTEERGKSAASNLKVG